MKLPLLFVAISLIVVLPALVHADVIVQPDSCVASGGHIRAYFTVVNTSTDFAICGMEFIPDPQPPSAGCTAADCGAVPDWACWLNGFGGAGYANPPYNNPTGCVGGGERGGFYITLQPGQCCYRVRYWDETLTLVLEQRVCFTCGQVPTESSSWGSIKVLYDE